MVPKRAVLLGMGIPPRVDWDAPRKPPEDAGVQPAAVRPWSLGWEADRKRIITPSAPYSSFAATWTCRRRALFAARYASIDVGFTPRRWTARRRGSAPRGRGVRQGPPRRRDRKDPSAPCGS